jgi:hypothetical protein
VHPWRLYASRYSREVRGSLVQFSYRYCWSTITALSEHHGSRGVAFPACWFSAGYEARFTKILESNAREMIVLDTGERVT